MSVVRWALVGCGDIARRRVAPAMRDLPECELIAVNRAQAELAEPFAREFGARRWYADWHEAVRDPEVDAVYVATPVNLHAPQTIAAAEAGKHVLCEKPMALDTAECDRMIAACAANGVKLGLAYYRRYYPAIKRIKHILESGEIGQPSVAQINVFNWFDPAPGEAHAWLIRKAEAGGGPLFDVGSHRLEALLHLFGPVRRVEGLSANVQFDREVEDTAAVVMQFERGPFAVLTVTHAAAETQDTLDIFGTRGSIHAAVLNEGRLQIQSAGGKREEAHPPVANSHLPLIADFAQAVLEDRRPAVDGETGREVARLTAQVLMRRATPTVTG